MTLEVPAPMVTSLLLAHTSLRPGPVLNAGYAAGGCFPKPEWPLMRAQGQLFSRHEDGARM